MTLVSIKNDPESCSTLVLHNLDSLGRANSGATERHRKTRSGRLVAGGHMLGRGGDRSCCSAGDHNGQDENPESEFHN